MRIQYQDNAAVVTLFDVKYQIQHFARLVQAKHWKT